MKYFNTDVKTDCSYKGRNASLGMDDLLGSVEFEGESETTLDMTLQDVVEFVQAAQDFSLDPRPHLNEYFPKFVWEYHEPTTPEEVAEIVSKCHYAVPAGLIGNDWSTGFYTATHRDPYPPRKVCFVQCLPSDEPDILYWPYEELEKIGAQILVRDLSGRTCDCHLLSPAEAKAEVDKILSAIPQP